jgi:hypothetical protein
MNGKLVQVIHSLIFKELKFQNIKIGLKYILFLNI